jgi:hypothetical protein
VLRNKKPVDITSTRMNIEDIIDDNARHEWGKILSMLGHPSEGQYGGEGYAP